MIKPTRCTYGWVYLGLLGSLPHLESRKLQSCTLRFKMRTSGLYKYKRVPAREESKLVPALHLNVKIPCQSKRVNLRCTYKSYCSTGRLAVERWGFAILQKEISTRGLALSAAETPWAPSQVYTQPQQYQIRKMHLSEKIVPKTVWKRKREIFGKDRAGALRWSTTATSHEICQMA